MMVSHSALAEGTFLKCMCGITGGRKVTKHHPKIAEQAKGSPQKVRSGVSF